MAIVHPLFWFTPVFPTCPTVAKQFLDIKRTSPEGNFNVADFPSFAISFATAPAALANCPPFPSVISMLCMAVLTTRPNYKTPINHSGIDPTPNSF